MLTDILSKCNDRYLKHNTGSCLVCSYHKHCPRNCEKCLDYIHNPSHAPQGAPKRKYDCTHMADFYTCKYSCRYTSEIIYALNRMTDLANKSCIKILSFGCGPCTDLFAIDYLRHMNNFSRYNIEYRGVDYSKDVWMNIHKDILSHQNKNLLIEFYYKDICDFIDEIAKDSWTPNLVVFQYVFSDMSKHSDVGNINSFIEKFAQYYNNKLKKNTYIILNDINLSTAYNGGREFFDVLCYKLSNSIVYKGRFYNENAKSDYYPRGYPYGDESLGEFSSNTNFFDLSLWSFYSPFNTCASAQMLIKKV